MSIRILVRAPNWLGDAVMSVPFVRRLRARHPGDVIDVLCRPSTRALYEGLAQVNETLTPGECEGTLALARRLKARRYAAAYVLPPSFSSVFLVRLAGVPERIGYAADFRGALLTRALRLEERYHYVRRYLGLLGEEDREVSREDLFFPCAEETGVDAFLAAQGLSLAAPALAVAPGSRAPARRWAPERFAETINASSAWRSVLLLGAPEDAPHAAAVEKLCRRPVFNLCGKTTLPLLGGLLRRCGALLTNESGLMHAGWAVGTRLLVVAGPSEPRVTSPFGPGVSVLQRREVPCVPCVRNECYRPADGYKECLNKIPSADALSALAALSR